MTIEQGWTEDESEESGDYELEGNEELGQNFVPVPVRIVFDENMRLAPTFCSHMTWPIPVVGSDIPVRVLPSRETRYKAKFIVNFTAAATLYMHNQQGPLGNPTPTGSQFIATAAGTFDLPDYDAMQPMYMIASASGVTVSIWDESFGAVASE